MCFSRFYSRQQQPQQVCWCDRRLQPDHRARPAGGNRPAPVDRHPRDLLTSSMSLVDQHVFVSVDTVRDNLTMWIPEVLDKTLVAAPYEAVKGWLKPFAGEGFAFGGNSGMFAKSPDCMLILQRGKTRLPDPVPDRFNGGVLQTAQKFCQVRYNNTLLHMHHCMNIYMYLQTAQKFCQVRYNYVLMGARVCYVVTSCNIGEKSRII